MRDVWSNRHWSLRNQGWCGVRKGLTGSEKVNTSVRVLLMNDEMSDTYLFHQNLLWEFKTIICLIYPVEFLHSFLRGFFCQNALTIGLLLRIFYIILRCILSIIFYIGLEVENLDRKSKQVEFCETIAID